MQIFRWNSRIHIRGTGSFDEALLLLSINFFELSPKSTEALFIAIPKELSNVSLPYNLNESFEKLKKQIEIL